jgi:uncharacterized delta-60 repeat protein
MKNVLSISVACVLCLFFMQRACAHAGDPDPTFGQGGLILFPSLLPASPFDRGNKVAIQPDGKILIVGRAGGDASGIWRSAFAVIRVNPDGTLDHSFGPNADGYFIFPWADGPAEARAIAFDTDGDIVVGGNVANLAGVVWLTPNGVFDVSKGQNGAMTFAVNGDTANQTTLNGLLVDDQRASGNSTYGVVFTGTYNGSGHPQIAVGWYSYDQSDPRPGADLLVQAFDARGSIGQSSVATSIVANPNLSGPTMTVGGYADYASSDGNHTNCIVDDFDVIGQFDNNGNLYFTWAEGTPWVGRFSTADSAEAECFVDALASTALGNYVIAGGREILDTGGAWRAMYFQLHRTADGYDLMPYYNVFELSPWGDNSIREVLPEDNARWAFAGFSGIDFSGVPDPVVARFNFLDGSLDYSFGYGGRAVLDFDPDTNAWGQTLGAALDAHACIVQVGTYWNGGSDANGNDFTQMFVSRLQPDSGDTVDTIFANGFERATSLCGP